MSAQRGLRPRRSVPRKWTSRIWSISRQSSISSDTTPSTSTSANASRQCQFQCSHISERVTHSTQGVRRSRVHQMVQEEAQGQAQETNPIQQVIHTQEEEQQGLMVQEEHSPQEEGIQAVIQAAAVHPRPHSSQEEQEIQVAIHLHPPVPPPSSRSIDPWASLDRSRKSLPKLSLPSNYKSCSILDMQQMLEVWYDKSTFAIATWRGDAQRYWLTQVLDCARARHDQWLQSTPSQRATLEPAYILGDRKHIPEAHECS